MSGLLKWVNVLAFLAMIIINAMANLLPIGGHTTGQISSQYPNLFTPAPFTFAIWGVIYLFMCIYIVMQLVMSNNNMSLQRVQSSIGIWFIVSCLFNIAWIFCWHYSRIGLSVVAMLLLLLTLIIINVRLTIGPNATIFEYITVYGFNIYLGWITAATIANISVFLVKIKWSGFGISDVIWTYIVIAVATLISIGFVMFGRRYLAAGAIIWAFWGIFMKHISSDNAMRKPSVAACAMIAIAIIVACMIISVFLPRTPKEA